MLFTICFDVYISKCVIVFIETTRPIFFFSYNACHQPTRKRAAFLGAAG
jgi:hypothetical protein